MTRWRLAALPVAALLIVLAAAYWLSRPGPPRFSRTRFSALPGWNDANLNDALAAFVRSCALLAQKPAAAPMGGIAGTVGDWRGPCAEAARKPGARQFFESRFTPYAVGAGFVKAGLFTGYYEPGIAGSRSRHGPYQAPVYGLPPDLVRADLGLFDPRLGGEHISGRLEGHALKPYPDRAAIDAGGAPGAPILLYADPVSLFFLQIQGSGRVTLDDGSRLRLAYAGENGQAYTAIGRVLVRQGALALKDVTLQSIRAWLAAHPGKARAVMEADKSYVFFRAAPLDDPVLGSPGTLGAPLSPLANLAVDPRLHALGAPYYVAATGADPVAALMIAADTGGAIRGAVRGDIFFGFGPNAERRAGAMKAPGRLYMLVPNALAARLGATATEGP